jgi:WD40-like Beta Propeller Repeat
LVYRVRPDGTGLEKALEQPILTMGAVSPDGQWLVAWATLGGDGAPAWQAFPLGGGTPVTIGSATIFDWSPDGSSLAVTSESGAPIPEGRSYLIPLSRSQTLPRVPAGVTPRRWEVVRRQQPHGMCYDAIWLVIKNDAG